MNYTVDLAALTDGFYDKYKDSGWDKDKENLYWIFFRLVNINSSFKNLVHTFNGNIGSYIMTKDEIAAFMRALMCLLDLSEGNELDEECALFDVEF
jgi:hypothetical protein